MSSWIEIIAGGHTDRYDYVPAEFRTLYGHQAPEQIANWVNGLVERRIAEGHNRVEVEWSMPWSQRYILDAPSWGLQPIKRLRLELARRKYRKSEGR